jgi:hypothetical protein
MVKATHVLGITLLVCCILQASFLTGARREVFVAQHAHCFSCVRGFQRKIARETKTGRRLAFRPARLRAAHGPGVDSQRTMVQHMRASPRSRAAALPAAGQAFGGASR